MSRAQPSGLRAAVTWARADLARRWRWLVVLGVIAGLTAGLAMAAVAGARRTDTALPRLSDQTRAADAVIFPGQVGVFAADWGPLLAQPYVTHLARWNLAFGNVDDEPGAVLFIPSDEHWLGDVDRPVIIDGRMFDPAAADEVVVDENIVEDVGLAVGDTFTFTPYGPDQDDLEAEPPNGPDLPMTVVGVIRFTSQFLFQDDGFVIPSPGVLARHGDRMMPIENAHVRLADPSTDIARLQSDVNDLVAPGTPILDLGDGQRRVETTITLEQTALLVLAALVALAGLVFVGQALGRSVAVIDDSREPLRAIGFTRGALTAAAVVPHLVVAGAATLVGAATAAVLSPQFPIGFAGRVDPDRGLHADWTVLTPGVVVTVALVLGGTAMMAWLRSGTRPSPSARSRARSTWSRSTVAGPRPTTRPPSVPPPPPSSAWGWATPSPWDPRPCRCGSWARPSSPPTSTPGSTRASGSARPSWPPPHQHQGPTKSSGSPGRWPCASLREPTRNKVWPPSVRRWGNRLPPSTRPRSPPSWPTSATSVPCRWSWPSSWCCWPPPRWPTAWPRRSAGAVLSSPSYARWASRRPWSVVWSARRAAPWVWWA
ncbi:MAG: ABC transporter permease [Actinomycetota bacterium]|nr:ABC transporter permease [Actinomycetota bacterium]